MKRLVIAVVAAIAVAVSFGYGSAAYAAEHQPPGASGLSDKLPGMGNQDKNFVKTASGLLEPLIDMSKLGVEKASDPKIKALSQDMANAYPDLLAGLEKAAGTAGLSLANEPDPHGVHRVQRLRDSGEEFDLAYLIEQDGLHEKLIAIYGMETTAGDAGALKAHAEKGHALLQQNLEQIRTFRAAESKERTTPGR